MPMYTSSGKRWNMLSVLLFGASNYVLPRAAWEFTLNDFFPEISFIIGRELASGSVDAITPPRLIRRQLLVVVIQAQHIISCHNVLPS